MGFENPWIEATAVVDERLYGPLPDIVQTQGRHLVRHPDTPVLMYRTTRDSFLTDLHRRLEDVQWVQGLRRRKYGLEIAEEWPISHTPPEVKSDYDARQRKLMLDLEAPTPPEDKDDFRGQYAPPISSKEDDAGRADIHGFPTPPSSFPRDESDGASSKSSNYSTPLTPADDKPLAKPPVIQIEDITTSTIQLLGQIAGKKRSRSEVDSSAEETSRRVRCRPTRSPYRLRSMGMRHFLEAT